VAALGGFGCWGLSANHERGGLRSAREDWHASEGVKVKRASALGCVNNAAGSTATRSEQGSEVESSPAGADADTGSEPADRVVEQPPHTLIGCGLVPLLWRLAFAWVAG
jgi:hypothetical protein